MSLRRMDFHCAAHGFFEAAEAVSAPVSEAWPCPKCGEQSAKVWLKPPSIGKIQNGYGHVTRFPVGDPRSKKFVELPRDYCEDLISRKEGVPFANDPGFAERIVERAEVLAHKREVGEVPPRPEPTPEQIEKVTKELAKTGITQ